MAKAKRRKSSTRGGSQSRAARSGKQSANRRDAIGLLMADHREVEAWLAQFEKTRSADRKRELAEKICAALKAHTTIEEELFYPAFLEATGDEDLHHEAEIEHASAKKLIAEIEASSPDDEYYDARVKVLGEMVKHHVCEEEKDDGMFRKARASDMDLEGLLEPMMARKEQVMARASAAGPIELIAETFRRGRSRVAEARRR